MKIVTVVGARPQFVKAAGVSRKLREQHTEILVHTGQYHDYEMSVTFYDGLDVPTPDVILGVGSGSHADQTGAMLKAIEYLLLKERPDWLLVYGDTNSALAGAMAASKVAVPVAHIEAGLRSFNRRMPEEINRVVTDHLSTLLLCPSDTAVRNLAAEGISQRVHVVGDVMLDILNWATERALARPTRPSRPPEILDRLGVTEKGYVVATVHRSANTEGRSRLWRILGAFDALDEPVLFAVHPRTRQIINEAQWQPKPHVHLIDPVRYLDMVTLTASARLVLTDSGGLQKEAYWLGVPCITLRDETEWVETVDSGWNTLAGADTDKIVHAVRTFVPPDSRPTLYGDGSAADRCVDLLGHEVELDDGHAVSA